MAKILLIDDDSVLRRVIKRVLTNAHHQVIEAENGLEGIRTCRAERPDIVVLDIVMPEQDGIQTVQEIRDIGLACGVIAISGGGVRGGELYLTIAKQFGSAAPASTETTFEASRDAAIAVGTR
jgi:CheY-like chemotaxis protein